MIRSSAHNPNALTSKASTLSSGRWGGGEKEKFLQKHPDRLHDACCFCWRKKKSWGDQGMRTSHLHLTPWKTRLSSFRVQLAISLPPVTSTLEWGCDIWAGWDGVVWRQVEMIRVSFIRNQKIITGPLVEFGFICLAQKTYFLWWSHMR